MTKQLHMQCMLGRKRHSLLRERLTRVHPSGVCAAGGKTGGVTPAALTTPTLKDAQSCKAKFLWQCLRRLPLSYEQARHPRKPGALRAKGDLFTQRTERSGSSTRAATCTCMASGYVHVHGRYQPGSIPAQPLAGRCRPGLTPQLLSEQPSLPSVPLLRPGCILH